MASIGTVDVSNNQTMEQNQICIACSKMHSIGKEACECGHVLKGVVASKRDRSNKRKSPYDDDMFPTPFYPIERPMKQKKTKESDHVIISKPLKLKPKSKIIKQNKIKTIHKKIPLIKINDKDKRDSVGNRSNSSSRSNSPSITTSEIRDKTTNLSLITDIQKYNILKDIKNSPKNVYSKRSKQYRPAKLHELDFEFDFTLFDSNSPYYPNALDDINEKINRDKSFWKAIF